MKLSLHENITKPEVFKAVEEQLGELSLKISDTDDQRPWGGFFVIDSESENDFIDTFFPEINKDEIYKYGSELSPKILLVEPNQKLSWQYHNRRAELWKAVIGPVGVMVSKDDEQPDSPSTLNSNEIVEHGNQIRHRLVGLDNWGVVAEIWQHTDPSEPSDESDIIRLEDSYGRG